MALDKNLDDRIRQGIKDRDLKTVDVLRMLKLLAEAEQVIRRTPNVRLHVETLLVQWTLLDRTGELSEVMDALGGRADKRMSGREAGGSADKRMSGSPESTSRQPEVMRDAAPASSAHPPIRSSAPAATIGLLCRQKRSPFSIVYSL